MLSQRSAFDPRQNRLELARRAALASGKRLLDLTQSNPTQAGLSQLDPSIAACAARESHRYEPEPFGRFAARAAISAWLTGRGRDLPPERIALTASTSEAYAFLFKLLCDPGDEILVPAPSYPLFEHLAKLESVRAVPYPLRYDGRWHLAPDELERARGSRSRAVIVVHPNNPTGSFLKRDELARLAGLGLPIISDEVFEAFAFEDDPSRVGTAHECQGPLVFSLQGLSKLVGLPQWKLAWIGMSGPEPDLSQARARLELIADTFLSVATPVQLALPEILARQPEATNAIRSRLAGNLALLRARCAGAATSLLHVEGGWYATLRPPAVLDDEGWALDLLESASVLVQPGFFYDFESGPYLVLSLLTSAATFAEGSERVLRRIAELAR